MIAAREVPAPDPAELRAAGLAALAEAGLLFLPAHMILSDVGELHVSAPAAAVPFVAAYVLGVLVACRFRASTKLTTAAAVVALVAGITLGAAEPQRTLIALLLSMLVTLRAVTLALRDWREPIHAEIGVGATVLGIEVLVAAGASAAWRTPLLGIVPVFFIAALASRATTVWAPVAAEEPGAGSSWIRRAAIATLGLVAAMALAPVLAVRGGLFERIGAWFSPAGTFLLSILTWLLLVVSRPILWTLSGLGVDPDAIRDLLEQWRARAQAARATSSVARPDQPWWPRLLGLAIFVGILWLLYRSLRRLRPDVGAFERTGRRSQDAPSIPLPEPEEPPARRGPLRREPPADTVRRWYAEALIALHRRGVPKDPALTPAEYLPEVAAAFPDCAEGFGHLTRVYEDVRYGNRGPTGETLHRLEGEVRRVLATLRRPS